MEARFESEGRVWMLGEFPVWRFDSFSPLLILIFYYTIYIVRRYFNMWLNKLSVTSFGEKSFLPLWLSLLHDWFYPFVWVYKGIKKLFN